MPFADATFDIVTSAGAITQTPDTAGLVAEMHRVLKPGGWLSAYEWQRSDRPYSDDMRYWFKMEGLTYALQTMDGMRAMLAEAGFAENATEDATDWYRADAPREYALMKGDLYPRMVEALGRAQADHFVENWRAMTVVIDNGEMRTGYVRGRKESS